MTTTIALAGKGGVGKTTVAAMIIKYLAQSGRGAIFAIDADPSSNLNMVLGLDLDWTVGEIREDMLSKVKESITAGGAAMGGLPGGVSKLEHLDYEIRSSLSEGIDFDLIAMGRGEGRGCYCAVNHNLRDVIDTIGDHYSYVVVDNWSATTYRYLVPAIQANTERFGLAHQLGNPPTYLLTYRKESGR